VAGGDNGPRGDVAFLAAGLAGQEGTVVGIDFAACV
jgi:ubiquinone/menaquinone biosynthesis C-methylase UbiE